MHTHPLRALAALAASLLSTPALWAQFAPTNSVSATNLPPIVVQASRTGQTASEIGSGVTIITADQIQRAGVGDTVQALERLGGLYFRRLSGNPAQAEVSMRGFSQNAHGRVLVLVDGQRLNEPDQAAPNWSRIPVQSIDRIEVLHGGQTALYGNYAVAGVINIVTKSAKEAQTTLTATVGSDDTYATHLHKSGSFDGATRYSADVDWAKSQGWRANSEYETYDARVHLDHDWTARFSSSLDASYNWGEYGMPGPLTKQQMQADPQQSTTPLDNARSETWGFTLGSRAETVDAGEFSVTLTGQRRLRHDEFPSYFPPSASACSIDSVALSPRYQLDQDIGGHRNLLTLGADAGVDKLKLMSVPLIAGPKISDVRLNRLDGALYARDEFFLSDTLSVALGARGEAMRTSINGTSLDWWSAQTSDLDDSSIDRETANDATLLFRPTARQKYFMRASTLYRFPFLDEYGSYRGFTPGFNSGLSPERGWQIESGLACEVFDGVVYDLRVFQLNMQDEIAWGNNKNENLDETRRNGLETGLRWTTSRRDSIGVSYQLLDAEFSAGANEGKEIPLVPAQVLTVDGELQVAYGISLLGAMRAASSQYFGDDNGNLGDRIAGYSTFDTGVRYVPTALKDLSILFSCDNVFDTTYATTGFWGWNVLADTYYPANGRTWRMSASYAF